MENWIPTTACKTIKIKMNMLLKTSKIRIVAKLLRFLKNI